MLDLSISFTASRDLDHGGEEVILNVLTVGIPLCRTYITGGCIGGDAFIGRWLFDHHPEAEHLVLLPYDRSRVDYWWEKVPGIEPVRLTTVGGLYKDPRGATVKIVFMPHGSTYKDRNAKLVRRGTAVCAFPAFPEDHPASARSGSWQTARMARRLGKLCRWDCVKPPYTGRIEKPLGEFMAEMQDG